MFSSDWGGEGLIVVLAEQVEGSVLSQRAHVRDTSFDTVK